MKKAFALVEVLVTLGIIGIVAAMTLPGIINDYKEKELITRLKVAYSELDSALKAATIDYGTVDSWGNNAAERATKAEGILPKYLKILKKCEKSNNSSIVSKVGCLGSNYRSMSSSTVGGSTSVYLGSNNAFLLINGITFYMKGSGDRNCSASTRKYNADISSNKENWLESCFDLFVDLNGPKRPNTSSIDWFSFYVLTDGIVPTGTQGSDKWSWVLNFSTQCLGSGVYSPENQTNCTAWVLVNENMDYRRCPEKLGWKKASSCKVK